jgi:hypothetical protein
VMAFQEVLRSMKLILSFRYKYYSQHTLLKEPETIYSADNPRKVNVKKL